MPVERKEIQYSVGVEDLYICMMLAVETADAIPTYEETIYQQSNITDLTISSTNTNFVKWASNKKIINVTKKTAFGLAFNLAGLNREVKDKIFGKTRTKGISFETAKAIEYPKFAVGAIFPLNDGTKLARWYPRCTVAPVEESWKTQNDEMIVDDIAYTITADPLLFNDVTQVELDTGAEEAAGVTVEDFMTQVVCDDSQIATLFPGGITVQVTPESASVAVSGTQQLNATVIGATNMNVTWTTSDNTVATVSTTGLVTVDSAATTGETTTITATSAEDPTKSDTSLITVS